jgi:ribonuclease-3
MNTQNSNRTNGSASKFKSISDQLNYIFSNETLLNEALTHSTYAYEHRMQNLTDNERLEFLGDAVLDLVISEVLFNDHEIYSEGFMTKTRAMVVCENTLANAARNLGLGELLLLGKGEASTGGSEKASNLANAMEALFGAIFLDGGYESAKSVILKLLNEPLQLALNGDMVYDHKSKLLELVQSTRGSSTMRFEIIDEQGPVHDRIFTAAVIVDDKQISTGRGSSKKESEQNAAKEALKILSCNRISGCQTVPLE